MRGPPVVITATLGRPVTNVISERGAVPMTVVNTLGEPVTLVAQGGEPVTLFNANGTLWDYPFSLFANNEQGAWYDPSDFSTLYQTSTGTTPVTAVEQPVGLMLDRSRGLVLGPELVTNGDFSDGATGWSVYGGTLSVSGLSNELTITNNGADYGEAYQLITTVSGKWYRVIGTMRRGTVTSVSLRAETTITSGNLMNIVSTSTTNVTITGYFQAQGATTIVGFAQGNTTNGTGIYDNISVRELPGNHARQATSASRPVLRSRYNLLTYSEQFDNAAWANTIQGTGLAPTITANAGTDPLGGSTADRLQFSLDGGTTTSDITRRRQSFTTPATSHTFSVYLRSTDGVSSYSMHIVGPSGATTNIVVTGAWQRFTVTEAGSGGNTTYSVGLRGGQSPANANTADVLAWGAQLQTAADEAATGGAYQRIAAATDYDTSNPVWRPYLAFDGTDDSFGTSSIDFSATDEMTVFAGVTKLSDAALGILAELAVVSGASNPGSFFLTAPRTAATGDFAFNCGGTAFGTGAVSANSFAAPTTRVMTGIGDISGDVATLRIDGAQVATSATDQGTGNFGNYPLYIGRRGGSSLPLNGRLYSLAILGRTATDAELASMETWVAGKTGVNLP